VKIIVIDPGTIHMGYAVLISSIDKGLDVPNVGVLSEPQGRHRHERLYGLFVKLRRIIKAEQPDIVAVESGYVGKANKKTSIAIGEAKAIAEILAAEFDAALVEIAPKEAKLAVCGRGNATKESVRTALTLWVDIENADHIDHIDLNASDALAVAITASGKDYCVEMTKRGH